MAGEQAKERLFTMDEAMAILKQQYILLDKEKHNKRMARYEDKRKLQQKERYHQNKDDPLFKARRSRSQKKWRESNPDYDKKRYEQKIKRA